DVEALCSQFVDENRARFNRTIPPAGLDRAERERAVTGPDLEHLARARESHQQPETGAFRSAAAGAAERCQLFLTVGEPAVERSSHSSENGRGRLRPQI